MPYLSCSSRPVSVSSTAAFGLPFSSRPAVSPRRLRSRGASVVSTGRSLVPVGSSSFSRMPPHLLVPNGRGLRPRSPTSLGSQPGLVKAADGLAGHQPALAGELVDDRIRSGDALGGVDDDRDGGHVPAQLEQPVAVRGVVAVEAPDAAQRGGAAEPGRTQPPDDGAVFRLKKAARWRRPCAVPSTPSSAVAPSTPRRCSRSQTATKAGTR